MNIVDPLEGGVATPVAYGAEAKPYTSSPVLFNFCQGLLQGQHLISRRLGGVIGPDGSKFLKVLERFSVVFDI
jgi:hypothetical protein